MKTLKIIGIVLSCCAWVCKVDCMTQTSVPEQASTVSSQSQMRIKNELILDIIRYFLKCLNVEQIHRLQSGIDLYKQGIDNNMRAYLQRFDKVLSNLLESHRNLSELLSVPIATYQTSTEAVNNYDIMENFLNIDTNFLLLIGNTYGQFGSNEDKDIKMFADSVMQYATSVVMATQLLNEILNNKTAAKYIQTSIQLNSLEEVATKSIVRFLADLCKGMSLEKAVEQYSGALKYFGEESSDYEEIKSEIGETRLGRTQDQMNTGNVSTFSNI